MLKSPHQGRVIGGHTPFDDDISMFGQQMEHTIPDLVFPDEPVSSLFQPEQDPPFSLLMVLVNEQEMYMALVSLGSFRPRRLQILLTVLSVTCAASAISLFECLPNISSTRTHVWKLFLPTVDLTSSISCALRLTVLMLTLSLWERTLSDRIAKFTTSSSSISSVHSILCLGMSVVDDSGVAHEFSADPFTPVLPLLTFISI